MVSDEPNTAAVKRSWGPHTIAWPSTMLQRAADAVMKHLVKARISGDAIVIARIALQGAVRHIDDVDDLLAANRKPATKHQIEAGEAVP
jgi:hypothetical protein